MQLIRAINKSNKSNNNNGSANQTSSTNNNNSTNKVVIVAPPQQQQSSSSTSAAASASLQVSQNANNNNNNTSSAVPSPVSPSASLPPLKKRTTIVKQAVPPPPPPRKSSPAPPRSSKSNLNPYCTRRIIVDVEKLDSLSEMEMQSGSLKVKKWLESVEISPSLTAHPLLLSYDDEISIRDEVTFKSVRKLIESFTLKANKDEEEDEVKKVRKCNLTKAKRKISDSSIVKARIEGFNTLERKARNQSHALKSENSDSGIEISSKTTSLLKFHHQFSRDGEFV